MPILPDDITQRIAAGDAGAMEAVIKTYSAQLLAHAYRYLGDQHSAEDVVQDVMIKLWAQAGNVQYLRAWLFRATANTALNQRSKKRVEANHVARMQITRVDPFQVVLDRDELSAILPHLTPRQTQIVRLRASGYKVREIAEDLGIQHITVRTVLHDLRHGHLARRRQVGNWRERRVSA